MQVCPTVIDDMQCEVLYKKKSKVTYCIGNIDIDSYIFVNEKQKDAMLAAISYMDGMHSLEEIQELLLSEHNIKMDINSLYAICSENGFIRGVEKSGKATKGSFNEMDVFMVNLFSININKFSRIFVFLAKYMRLIVSSMIIISAGLLTLLFTQSDRIITDISWGSLLSDATTIIFYMIVSTISIILHESSHVVTAYLYGVKAKALTIALYAYVTPMFYVRLHGIYMIKPKNRILIWASGSFMNFFLLILCFVLMHFTAGTVSLFFMTGVACNLILGVYSLFPLVISDGYYILATLLKTPNLRKSAFSKTLNILKGSFNKESLIYAIYCLVFVSVLAFFLISEIYAFANFAIQEYYSGTSFWQFIRNYINIIIFVIIGIMSKIITALMRLRKPLEQ